MIARLRRLALLGLCALSFPLLAADFPAKPITLILPFPPGGLFDPEFRTLSSAETPAPRASRR